MSSSPVSVQNSKLTVVSVTPRADTRAPANTNIVITFSEDIVKGSGSIVVRNWNYQIILDESIDSPEAQEAWEKQKVIDEEDLEEEEVDQDADPQL